MGVEEFWLELRSSLAGDATLSSLLGTPPTGISDSVYFSFPGIRVNYPIITIGDRNLNPQTSKSFAGVYRPEFTLRIFSDDPYANDKIFTHLEETFAIPSSRTSTIDSDNYRISLLRFSQLFDMGAMEVVDTGEQIWGAATIVDMRASKKTAA